MSKIHQIQSGSLSCKNQSKMKNVASKQSFNGGVSDPLKDSIEVTTKIVKAELNKRLGVTGKIYQWLAKTTGEVQTQSINALFTATLAPIFIIHNPFVHKSKEDKKYLALRQPISAGIALTGGLGMTLGINHYMDAMYNEGYHKAIDLRIQPSKSYLKRKFRKQKEIKDFNEFKNAVHAERLDFFSKLISENPENIKFDEKSKIITIKGKDIQEGHKIRVPNFENEKELKEYLKENNFYNIKLRNLMENRFGFEFYGEKDGVLNGKLKPDITKSKLSETNAMEFFRESGLIEPDKVNEDDLRKMLSIHQQQRNVDVIEKEIFEEYHLKSGGGEKLLEVFGKTANRIAQMLVGEKIGKTDTITIGQCFHQLRYKQNDGSLQELMDKPVAKALMELKGRFKGKLDGFNDKADLEDFSKNYLKKLAGRLEKNAKNYKNYTGIFFNLFTTAVTCTVLNYAYPRIVDKYWPELSEKNRKAKKQEDFEFQKGGNK